MTKPEGLRAIDGLMLSAEHRAALRPGEAVSDENGSVHHLPRFFFEVPSWEEAHTIRVATHFTLSELITVDSREAELLLRTFPHYVPCAILALARYLEDFRREVDAPVFISANGGYRSPAHRVDKGVSLHSWGTAADIYRVGDAYLEEFLKTHEGRAGWRTPLEREGVRTVVVKPDVPLASLLRQEAGWRNVFEDEQAVIFVRE